MQNALEVHHVRASRRALLACCASDENGTTEDELVRALLAFGAGVDEYTSNDARGALAWVRESLLAGRPVVLCVDRWEHWVTLIGVVGRQFVGWDSAGWSGWRHEMDGVFILQPADLQARWEASKRARGRSPRFYGIGVGAPAKGGALLTPATP